MKMGNKNEAKNQRGFHISETNRQIEETEVDGGGGGS